MLNIKTAREQQLAKQQSQDATAVIEDDSKLESIESPKRSAKLRQEAGHDE